MDAERTALFIDGANFYVTVKTLELEVDYQRLLDYFSRRGRMIRAYYYTAIPNANEFSSLRKLMDFLQYNGYNVVSKVTREYIDLETNRVRIKGNMDMELALDMLKLAPRLDHAYLFSGDGDFCRLLEEVQELGTRVTVVSSIRTQPAMAADVLRRKADEFIELDDIADHIRRRHHDMEEDGFYNT